MDRKCTIESDLIVLEDAGIGRVARSLGVLIAYSMAEAIEGSHNASVSIKQTVNHTSTDLKLCPFCLTNLTTITEETIILS